MLFACRIIHIAESPCLTPMYFNQFVPCRRIGLAGFGQAVFGLELTERIAGFRPQTALLLVATETLVIEPGLQTADFINRVDLAQIQFERLHIVSDKQFSLLGLWINIMRYDSI